MGKIGANRTVGCGAPNGVTHSARTRKKNLHSATLIPRSRTDGRMPLPVKPMIVLLGLFGDDFKGHVRMLHAAEFRACATPHPFLVRPEPGFVCAPGNQIHFAAEIGCPEA